MQRTRAKLHAGDGRLADDIAALAAAPMTTLHDRWKQAYGRAAPSHLSRSLLIQSIAYRMQVAEFGGLTPALLRRLLAFAAPLPSSSTKKISGPVSVKLGTVLLREWQGVTYSAEVVEGGIVFQGKVHRSLSTIARQITGQRWSGPRFFGLLPMQKKSVGEIDRGAS